VSARRAQGAAEGGKRRHLPRSGVYKACHKCRGSGRVHGGLWCAGCGGHGIRKVGNVKRGRGRGKGPSWTPTGRKRASRKLGNRALCVGGAYLAGFYFLGALGGVLVLVVVGLLIVLRAAAWVTEASHR
jgi:hypothetical protein